MSEEKIQKPQQLARQKRYLSNWVNVYVDRVQFPAGNIAEEYHIIEYSSEAAAAIIENDSGQVLLARIYRYATDRVEWEIPGGRLDPGETPVQTALREALEETGWQTTDGRLLYTFHPTNGISRQRFHVVHCRALSQTADFDPEEVAETRWFSKEEIRQMIREGELMDGFTLAGLLIWMME